MSFCKIQTRKYQRKEEYYGIMRNLIQSELFVSLFAYRQGSKQASFQSTSIDFLKQNGCLFISSMSAVVPRACLYGVRQLGLPGLLHQRRIVFLLLLYRDLASYLTGTATCT